VRVHWHTQWPRHFDPSIIRNSDSCVSTTFSSSNMGLVMCDGGFRYREEEGVGPARPALRGRDETGLFLPRHETRLVWIKEPLMPWVRYNPTGLDLRQGHAASARPFFAS
jgi:hypothetical protein